MRLMYALFVVVVLGFSTNRGFTVNVYRVGVLSGASYSELLKKWSPQQVSVWIFSNGKYEGIAFQTDASLGKARAVFEYTTNNINILSKTVAKAIKWSKVAKENKADVLKSLGCFGNCVDGDFGVKNNRLTLTFFAANEGSHTHLVLEIIDAYNISTKNMSTKDHVHIRVNEMKRFLKLIDKIKPSFAKVRKKEKLFK